MLRSAGVPFAIVTLNPDGAAEAQREGFSVRLGDSSRAHGLHLLAIEKAKMLVCADDEPATARRIAAVARTLNPTLAIVVRSAFGRRCDPRSGADQVIAEEMEAIVQMFVRVLDGYLVPRDEIGSPRRDAPRRRLLGHPARRMQLRRWFAAGSTANAWTPAGC